jgi:hypothetical protein
MGEILIREGDMTVRVTDNLDEWVDREIARGIRAVVEAQEEIVNPVAEAARASWYGPEGVTRRTGKSGDIIVTTTIDMGAGEVRTAVGSTDTRIVKGRDGRSRPRATAIHRPGALAMEWVEVTESEYWRLFRENERLGRRLNAIKHDKKTGKHYAKKLKDKTSDGAYLLPLFIVNPARRAMRLFNRALGRRIALADGSS